MKKLYSVFAVAAVICGSLFFCGCAMVNGEPLGNHNKDPRFVVIGAVLPLSGPDAVYGKRMLAGLRFAEFELNSRRGISGKRMKLLPFDSKGTAEGAEIAFESAVAAGAEGVIAGYSSTEANAIAPLANLYRIPSIMPMATSDVASGTYLVRNSYTDQQQGEALAAYLWYWRQLIRISVLIDSDLDAVYERNTARVTAKAFRDLGGVITNMPEYRKNNFAKAVELALITGPQAVVVSARGELAAKIVTLLRQKGYKGVICGLDSWDDDIFFRNLNQLKDPGDCVYVSFFTPENPAEEFLDFRNGFRQKYFHDPGSCETMSYDALKMLAIGLNNAQTEYDFRTNWLSIHNYFGAAATYTALNDGGIDRTMFINAVDPAQTGDVSAGGRLIRSFMHSKLQSYRY